MGSLDGHRYAVTGITFEATAHERPGRFTVPVKIAEALGSGDDLPIHLVVEVRGKIVFDGPTNLASGTEAYPIAGVGAHDPIRVTARRV